ncbi:MAG: hypothetical protein D3924_12090 [Candidatus Electrothrix sp. AR4]|nr:hypothetical protein [Candidatus Electrothrix sp. AR4]
MGAAVINPFCWPVLPSARRFARGVLTGNWDAHFDKWYFFASSKKRKERFEGYLDAYAKTIKKFCEKTGAWPVIVGMEALDFEACQRLQKKLSADVPIFSSEKYNAFELTAILEILSVLITSRYHARVLSLAAAVPTVAVSMDERLSNIYDELGQSDEYCLNVNDPLLAEKLPAAVAPIWRYRNKVSGQLMERHSVFLESLGTMGLTLHDFISSRFPGVSLRAQPDSWSDTLRYSRILNQKNTTRQS